MSGVIEPGAAVVAVSVATLWRSPDRIRDVDAPAVAAQPSVRSWAVGLSDEQQRDLDGRTDSQLLLGDPVLVEELSGGWARVVATGQPSSRDPRGYPGWIPASQLTSGEMPAPTHIMTTTVTGLHTAPGGPLAVADVGVGTTLIATSPVEGGWIPVALPAGGTGWIEASSVAPLPPPQDPRNCSAVVASDLQDQGKCSAVAESGAGGSEGSARTRSGLAGSALDVARQLLGVRYVWGGMSPFGIDCSGLVHLAFRRVGVLLPRDAHDQAAATRPLAWGDEQPGDVYLFARAGRPVYHIGFVTAPPDPDGTRHMLHASGGLRVVAEPISPERLETLVAVHRVV